MERFSDWVVRGARGVFERPGLAGALYLAALLGVLNSAFGVGRRWTSGDPVDIVLREFKRAGLRVIERRYAPGEIIFSPGDPDDRLYFVLSGTVRTYRLYGNYREATTAFLKDSGVFGGLSLSEGGPHEDFAEAVTGATVASARKASVAWLARREPGLSLPLFAALSERVRQSDEMVATLLPREVSGRLAALLLNLEGRFGVEDGEGNVVLDVRLPHRDLASMIASTREAVSKVMSEFRREGLIEVRDRRIVLLNRPALSERANGGGTHNGHPHGVGPHR
jgi:CRP-like cAMP-binding protein